jgi:hypothetical protein
MNQGRSGARVMQPRGGVEAAALATAARGEEKLRFGGQTHLRHADREGGARRRRGKGSAAEVLLPLVVVMGRGSGGSGR